MAITETRNLPAPFIQSLGEHYGKELPKLTADKMDTYRNGHQPLQVKIHYKHRAATLAGTQVKVSEPLNNI